MDTWKTNNLEILSEGLLAVGSSGCRGGHGERTQHGLGQEA